jgi:hypothetical protein
MSPEWVWKDAKKILHFTVFAWGREFWGCKRTGACWDCGFESCLGHGCLSCECCVLSGRGLCDELVTRPEESYRVWCV